MEFFNPNANVNFMGIRRYTVAISVFLVVASIVLLATRGLNFGLDFTGGSLVEVVGMCLDEIVVDPVAADQLVQHGAEQR